jgi:hypothetical protein
MGMGLIAIRPASCRYKSFGGKGGQRKMSNLNLCKLGDPKISLACQFQRIFFN